MSIQAKSSLSIIVLFFRLLRVHHWVKNLFIFLPLFFGGKFFHIHTFANLVYTFLSFSFVASVIYIINDSIDVESDRQHPQKRHRPLASGQIQLHQARMLGVGFLCSGFVMAYILDLRFFAILATYFILNLMYTFKLKHIPILDIAIVATGFLLRIFSGGIVADIPISEWLILMTFLLALFLGIAKRRDDVLIFNESGEKLRRSVDGYNLEFINASMVLMSSVLVVSYIMYTLSNHVLAQTGTDKAYLTTVFVILGLLRYLQISLVENDSGSPTKILLRDRFIQLTIAGWVLSFYYLLYW